MLTIPESLLVSYTLFSFFLFYQQLHVKNFQGANIAFGTFLAIFCFAAMLFGLGFLLYYGYKVSWLQAGLLFVLAFLIKIVWFAIEAKIGLRGFAWVLSLAGFVVIPVCGYFMWITLP